MTDQPAIDHDPAGQRFVLALEGLQAGLDYRLDGNRMVIEHTVVPEALGGRGLAWRLVQAAFDHARAQGWRVLPACSYARVWVGRHPDYADLLAD